MNTFPKQERLCGQLRIATLYKEGKRLTAFPLRVTYRRLEDDDSAPKVLVWAPKSLFKHAVDRNRLRRLMREAYRLNAQPLHDFCQANRCSFLVAFNYMDKELRSQAEVTKAMQKALAKLTATPSTRTTDK